MGITDRKQKEACGDAAISILRHIDVLLMNISRFVSEIHSAITFYFVEYYTMGAFFCLYLLV